MNIQATRLTFAGILLAVLTVCLIHTSGRIEIDLNRQAVRALQKSGLPPISVLVRGQTVCLNGTLSSRAQKMRAIQTVASLRGVQKVTDHLSVRPFAQARDSLKVFRRWLRHATLHFPVDQWYPIQKDAKILNALADSLKMHSTVFLLVAGYSDSSGSAARNTVLARKRAAFVCQFLKKRGFPKNV